MTEIAQEYHTFIKFPKPGDGYRVKNLFWIATLSQPVGLIVREVLQRTSILQGVEEGRTTPLWMFSSWHNYFLYKEPDKELFNFL